MDWDLSSYFSEFGSPVYLAYKGDLDESLDSLSRTADNLIQEEDYSARSWESLIIGYEHMLAKFSHLSSYLGCLVSAEADNEAYLKEQSGFADQEAMVSKLSDKIIRALGTMDQSAFKELKGRPRLEDATFRLQEMRDQAARRMSPDLEELAADLGINGISAWSRLYFTSMGQLRFQYTDPEQGPREAPVSQYNSLLCSTSRERRIAVYEGACETFARHKQTYAAALNAISGTRHTLNKRRGIEQFLEPSLRQSRINSGTLEALMTAIDSRLPFAREVFRYRTGLMGIQDPGYVDLRASLPIGGDEGPDWKDGVSLVSNAFNTLYPAMGAFFEEMIKRRWIDHTPRDNKRPGGFCSSSLAIRESRIFMTYKDTLSDVLTLAHEAGHAWHSRLLKEQRLMAVRYPMTLAESASTFAERILTEGVLADEDYEPAVKLVLLDAEIDHMLSFLLDLPVRFRFEKEFYEQRRAGNLSPADLCQLMKETQRQVFGDALAPGREDPWFWVSKLHFYIDRVEFYNYPYTFGYLLSTAYMARLRAGDSDALPAYERFLRNSGKMSCEEVVQMTLGEDIQDPRFWMNLIDELKQPFAKYQQLLKEYRS